jgi:hypothetical protein
MNPKTKKPTSLRRVAAQVGLSKDTVRNVAKEAGLKPFHAPRKPKYRSHTPSKRLKFAKDFRGQDWDKVVYGDEKKFVLFAEPNRRNTVYYIRPEDKENLPPAEQAKYPGKVNVWGAFCSSGVCGLRVFTQNMDANLYRDILDKTMLPSALEHYPDGDFLYLQDSDPKHRAKKVQKWFEENEVQVIRPQEWPGNSPDLNPIENLWSVLADNVAKRRAKDVDGLKKIIKEEWKKLPSELLKDLSDSMRARLKKVVKEKGAYVGY